jgi:hypothetical protein
MFVKFKSRFLSGYQRNVSFSTISADGSIWNNSVDSGDMFSQFSLIAKEPNAQGFFFSIMDATVDLDDLEIWTIPRVTSE